MTATTAALHRAANALTDRLAQLEARIAGGDEAAWADYARAAVALAKLAATTAPGARGELLTSAQMAESLGISARQLRRLQKSGKLTPAERLGPPTLRWRREERPA